MKMKPDHVSLGTKRGEAKRSTRGQAMIEYVIMTMLFLSLVTIMSIFLYTYKQHSNRIVDLVASEYP